MPLERVLEPEVMDTAEEAVDYDSMDHSEVNRRFVEDILSFAKDQNRELGKILDLGTGTALIPIELCKNDLKCNVVAIDLAEHMLELGRENVENTNLKDRIKLQKVDAKGLPFADDEFDCVMTNSIIHHIPKPESCIEELVRVVAGSGVIFVRDLMRPGNDAEVRHLVQTYAGDENAHSQKMFDDSLRAALSLDEIQGMVAQHGFPKESVVATSDRHWTWAAINRN